MMESLLLPSAMPARDCRPNQNPMWYEFFFPSFLSQSWLNLFSPLFWIHLLWHRTSYTHSDHAGREMTPWYFFFVFFFSGPMKCQGNGFGERTVDHIWNERSPIPTNELWKYLYAKKAIVFFCARAVHPFRISMRWSLFSVTALVAARTGGSDYRLWTEKFDHSFMAINVIFSTTFRPSEMALWSLNEIVVKYISGFTSIGFVCRIHVSKTWIEMRFSSSVRPECILKENRRVDKYLMITKTIITVRWYGHNHRTAWRSQNRNWM